MADEQQGNLPVTVGKKQYGPDEADAILANMQKIIDERGGALNTFLSGMKDAAAWTGGGIEGPTATLAVRDRQKQSEMQDLMKMQQEVAGIKAAQLQRAMVAKSLEDPYAGTGGIGGLGGVGNAGSVNAGVQLDPSQIAEFNRLKKLNPEAAADYRQKAINEQVKLMYTPGMQERKESVPVWDEQKQEYVIEKISPAERMDLERRGLVKPSWMKFQLDKQSQTPSATETRPQASSESVASQQGASVKSPEILKSIQTGVLKRESSGDTVDTSKPSVQGAIGPGQITPETFQTAKNLKLIPQDYNINDKKHNIATKDALLAHYYDKFNGDVDKTIAAYIGGPGVVNKDGTINYERKDALGTTVKDYISSTKKLAGLTSATAEKAVNQLVSSAQAATPPGQRPPPPASTAELERVTALRADYDKEIGKANVESFKKQHDNFLNTSEPAGVRFQETQANRLGKIIEKYSNDPDIVQLIDRPGKDNAIFRLLKDGLSLGPGGTIALQGIDDALQLSKPGITQPQIDARKEIKQVLRYYALEVSKMAQGQGAMSDFERRMFDEIAGSAENSWDMLRKTQAFMKARTNFYKDSRDLYDVYDKPGKPTDYSAFVKSAPYKELVNRYSDELAAATAGKGTTEGTQKPNATQKFNWDADKTKRFEQFKKNQGL